MSWAEGGPANSSGFSTTNDSIRFHCTGMALGGGARGSMYKDDPVGGKSKIKIIKSKTNNKSKSHQIKTTTFESVALPASMNEDRDAFSNATSSSGGVNFENEGILARTSSALRFFCS
jgi:hypothetical protein